MRVYAAPYSATTASPVFHVEHTVYLTSTVRLTSSVTVLPDSVTVLPNSVT